jgi:hypothetical protein
MGSKLSQLPAQEHDALRQSLQNYVREIEFNPNVPKSQMAEASKEARTLMDRLKGKNTFKKIDLERKRLGKEGNNELYYMLRDYLTSSVPEGEAIIGGADVYRQASKLKSILDSSKTIHPKDLSKALNRASTKSLSPSETKNFAFDRIMESNAPGSDLLKNTYDRLSEFQEVFSERGAPTSRLATRAAEKQGEIPYGITKSIAQRIRDIPTERAITQRPEGALTGLQAATLATAQPPQGRAPQEMVQPQELSPQQRSLERVVDSRRKRRSHTEIQRSLAEIDRQLGVL